jgi:hypothetical protein
MVNLLPLNEIDIKDDIEYVIVPPNGRFWVSYMEKTEDGIRFMSASEHWITHNPAFMDMQAVPASEVSKLLIRKVT